ncbi:hypothetical protein [Planococcus versutus]|uniref:RNA polymerase sigma-70 region 2 domain-containing protein n=1 Tax=Planococcus versutus TaxID=1302659 RepID=A0A1B1RZK4_9BACL|nr:hypothetical protein [Planococcus versutus]ANU26344.1 hypothetical protein I858_004760 [Planococcus versutus]
MTIDEKLMMGIRNREEQALSDLYDRYHRVIWKIAHQADPNHSVCEQLVTHVFRAVWTKPQDFMQNRKLVAILIEYCLAQSAIHVQKI